MALGLVHSFILLFHDKWEPLEVAVHVFLSQSQVRLLSTHGISYLCLFGSEPGSRAMNGTQDIRVFRILLVPRRALMYLSSAHVSVL